MATIEKYTNTAGAVRFAVRYRKPDRKQTTKRGFTTKRDARAFAETVEVTKRRGEYVSHSDGRVTIGELGPAWLDRQRARLKPSTFALNEKAWRLYVEPRWASVAVGTVRHTDVQAWTVDLSTRVGASFVGKAHGVLARILDDAVRDRLLVTNVARGVKLPTEVPPARVYLTAAQLHALAEASDRYYSLVLLLGTCGLRWGEATALRVCDVNFLRRRVEIARNVVYVNGVFHLGTPKTGSARSVALPASVIDALAETAKGKGREELLWTSTGRVRGARGRYTDGGDNSDGGYLKGGFFEHAVALCQAADPTFPRVTPHGLRHTAASLAISVGANPKVVQRMLGHASAAMTLDTYADLFESDLDAVAEKLEENVLKMCSRKAR